MNKSEDFTEGLFDEKLHMLRQRIFEETEKAKQFVSRFDPMTELRYGHPNNGPQRRTVEALLTAIDRYGTRLEQTAVDALGDEGDESEASITNLQNEASALLLELEAIMKAVECSAEEA